MQRIVAQYRLDGASLWVAQNGTTLLEAHYGNYGPRTQVAIASASKWVSALVLARLIERGALRFDSTVGEWWPDAPADKRSITLRQLFSHTSGLPGAENECLSNALTTLQACAAQILAGRMVGAPGRVFAYGGSSMQVAGAMAERATGLGWDVLLARELTTPLGMTGTDFGFLSAAPGAISVSNPRIAGGMRSTLDDHRKIMAMWQADGLVREGPLAGTRYLQPSTIRAMQQDSAVGTTVITVPPSLSAYPRWGYGFGFWIMASERAGGPLLESSPGAFGFQGWVDGAQGSAAVFMVRDSNQRMAPEVLALQRQLGVLLDFERRAGETLPAREAPSSRSSGPRDRRDRHQ